VEKVDSHQGGFVQNIDAMCVIIVNLAFPSFVLPTQEFFFGL